MQLESLKQFLCHELEELKATDIIALDVRTLTSITDLMIICTGNSARHVKAIANHLKTKAKQQQLEILAMEGLEQGDWILVDLNQAIVHIMQQEVRDFYQLEKLWDMPTS